MRKPKNLISKERAKELCNNFTPKYEDICKAIGKKDNRSTWYSLDELKEYIAYIEAQGKEKGFNVDGIRFYIGSYPKNDKVSGKSETTTVFLAPTGTKITTQKRMAISQNLISSDITEIEAFNFGKDGIPPGHGY